MDALMILNETLREYIDILMMLNETPRHTII